MTQGIDRIHDLIARLRNSSSSAEGIEATDAAAELEREQRHSERELRRANLARLQQLPLDEGTLQAIERDALEPWPAAIAVRRFLALRSMRSILVLHGDPGTGKSVAAADAAARRAYSAWAYPRDVLEAYMSRYAEALARRHALEHAPLLVIDGLGIERMSTDQMIDALVGLLPVRLRRRTIITTQLSESALLKRYAFAPLLSLLVDHAHHLTLRPREGGKP